MPIQLNSIVLPVYEQMLGGLAEVLRKAAIFCAENDRAEDTIVQARLAPDMLSFAWQVQTATTNSVNALKGALAARYELDRTPPPDTFAGLADRIAQARAAIAAVDPDTLDAIVGRDVLHVPRGVTFAAEVFLTGFAMPNFYFHVVTAYDIARAEGVPVGKKDYLGRLRPRT